MNPWLTSIPVAYLLGSIPFGYIFVRLFLHQDVRETGSGNTGATNVTRSSKALGLVTLVLDLGKAVLAVILAFVLASQSPALRAMPRDLAHLKAFDIATLAAVAVIVGHVFPVWLGFRGGKGVASALGVFMTLVPKAGIGILIVFLIVLALTRYVSLASMVAAASFPLFGFYFVRHPSPVVVFGFLFIPALIIFMHRSNISRLMAGTESRIGARKTQFPEPPL